MKNKDYYVDRHDTEKIEFGLEKIYKLLEVLGNPQDDLKVIHIAGTNGKGSVSSYLSYILACSGMKVGRISSPVIFDKMEFAQVYTLEEDGCMSVCDACEAVYDRLVETYKIAIEEIDASGYEVQVGLSLKYLLDERCDIVIVECGMGGALDATNVFTHTICDVITSISLDHLGMIGDSLEDIASCKCGIITKGADVVTTSSNIDVLEVIKSHCQSNNAKLTVAYIEDVSDIRLTWGHNRFRYKLGGNKGDYDEYEIILNGRHQIENAIIAIEVAAIIEKKLGIDICIKQGLLYTKQRGRLDIVSDKPFIIVDGAHNEDGARCLVEAVEEYFIDSSLKKVYLLSMFSDKACDKIIERVITSADKIVTFETDNSRCMKSKELKNIVEQATEIEVLDIGHISSLYEYIERLKDDDTVYICAGSLSFMKEIYGRFRWVI